MLPENTPNTPTVPVDTSKIMPGDEGYDAYIEGVAAEMDAQKEQGNASNLSNVPVPDYVPDKFRNAPDPMAAMAKAYAELEAKLGAGVKTIPTQIEKSDSPAPPTNAPVPPVVPAIPKSNTALNEATGLVSKAGLDFNELYNAYVTQGSLTEEQFVKLESAGHSRDDVKQRIAGIEAIQRESQRELLSLAGGEESYSSMLEWASSNLNEEEIAAFNEAVDMPNKAIQKLAISNLKMRFETGAPPTMLKGTPVSQGGSSDVFTSEAQVIAAMSDPRYQNDPAYQNMIGDKLSRSPNVF